MPVIFHRVGSYSETTIKILFALSGNVCAFRDPDGGFGCELRLTDPAWGRVRAQISHIRAASPGGPRFDSTMDPSERYAFENLILLCPNHHQQVDFLEPDRFTADVLTAMKALAEQQANPEWTTDARLNEVTGLLLAQIKATTSGGSATSGTVDLTDETVITLEGSPILNGSSAVLPLAEEPRNSFVILRQFQDEAPRSIECQVLLHPSAVLNIVSHLDVSTKTGWMSRFDSRVGGFFDSFLRMTAGRWDYVSQTQLNAPADAEFAAKVEFLPEKIRLFRDGVLILESVAQPRAIGAIGFFNEVASAEISAVRIH